MDKKSWLQVSINSLSINIKDIKSSKTSKRVSSKKGKFFGNESQKCFPFSTLVVCCWLWIDFE